MGLQEDFSRGTIMYGSKGTAHWITTRLGAICAMVCAAFVAHAAPAGSIASFCERAEKGERLTVAFLGGSLTWGANASDPNRTSWRAVIGQKLEERYPKAHFKFVDAGIGASSSLLGVFRVDRDVIKYKPDLVFVEFLVNDGEHGKNDLASCSFEGIVRRLLERLPRSLPVLVMLPPTRATVEAPDATKFARLEEHRRIAETYGLAYADVFGEMRRRNAAGKVDLDRVWPMWPGLIGDTQHPHDFGYSVYADIIWDQVFRKPSTQSTSLPDEWMFTPKYRHLAREEVFEWKRLPKGWHKDVCYVRAGTFDFLCSRWMDGLAVAANCVFDTKAHKYELAPDTVVEPLRATFRGEVLVLYGESAEWSSRCEVLVDGKLTWGGDSSDFGRRFAPTAYLVWQIGSGFDPGKTHSLEIRPIFAEDKPQEFRLSSICVAGRDAAWVRRE